jgi:hypothetical protein
LPEDIKLDTFKDELTAAKKLLKDLWRWAELQQIYVRQEPQMAAARLILEKLEGDVRLQEAYVQSLENLNWTYLVSLTHDD